MIFKLSLLMLTLAIAANFVSANPCLNFADWINFKNSYTTNYVDKSIAMNPYAIQFKDISHENIA